MKQLPGTNLEIPLEEARKTFDSLFSAGGLVLSQVCTICELETHMVQNWVKRKFVPPPKDKKYSKNQLCRIVTINMLRDVLSIDVVCSLISHINGVLEDDSDDLIDDSQLYFYFLDLCALCQNGQDVDVAIKKVIENYTENVVGARRKLKEVLKIMYTAYMSAAYRKEALLLFKVAEID